MGKGKITGLRMAVMKWMKKNLHLVEGKQIGGPGLKSNSRGWFQYPKLGLYWLIVMLYFSLSALWFCFMFLEVFMVTLKKKKKNKNYFYLIIRQMGNIICHIFYFINVYFSITQWLVLLLQFCIPLTSHVLHPVIFIIIIKC